MATILPFQGKMPRYNESNFLAETSVLVGDVELGQHTSIWFNTTIRGDVNWIRIGERSNIQDNCVVHVSVRTAPTSIGNGVTIGHGAIIHGCTIGDNVLVGIGAIILDKAKIEPESIVGANCLVKPGTVVPSRSLFLGSPGRVVRQLTDQEVEMIRTYAENYVRHSALYREDVPAQPDQG